MSAVPVIFHVATLMPYKETDQNCNAKKRHIGTNYITIVCSMIPDFFQRSASFECQMIL
jgi:hypothetical protein